MISRRALIAGGALALAGSASPARLQAANKSFLPRGLPEGVYGTATLETLPVVAVTFVDRVISKKSPEARVGSE